MRRGLLKDYANQVCQMAAGWRLTIADLPLLVERGQGTLETDLLERTAMLDGTPMPLTITGEIAAWLDEAKTRDGLADDLIQAFTLRLEFDISEDRSGREEVRHVRLDCRSLLRTADGEHQGHCRKREIWRRKEPTAVWLVHDE